MKRVNFYIAYFSLVCISCSNPSTFNGPANEPFTIQFQVGIDKDTVVSNEEIFISFENVITDTRCPIDINCAWSGEAEILINVGDNELTLDYFGEANHISNYYFTLIDLTPYQFSNKSIDPTEYVATICIVKKVNE